MTEAGPDARAVIDTGRLWIEVYQKFDEKYPVPEVLKPAIEQLIMLAVDCTLEVLVDDLKIGQRLD